MGDRLSEMVKVKLSDRLFHFECIRYFAGYFAGEYKTSSIKNRLSCGAKPVEFCMVEMFWERLVDRSALNNRPLPIDRSHHHINAPQGHEQIRDLQALHHFGECLEVIKVRWPDL
jgi:hypothetical protein